MVVLMEEFHGLTLKRKGADEPELFDVEGDDRSGFPLSCRATKMRRLVPPEGQHHEDEAPAVGGVGATGQVDLGMGDARKQAVAAAGEERAMVVYGEGPSDDDARSVPRLRPCAPLRAGADWVVRAMLRQADRRTVRELLASAREEGADLALAVVPWVPPSRPDAELPTAAVEAADGAAAMDVEEEEDQGPHWAGQTCSAAGAGCGEGYVYRWPQHCMAPPHLLAVGQASPVMWSW